MAHSPSVANYLRNADCAPIVTEYKPLERTLMVGICAKRMGYLRTRRAFLVLVTIFPKAIYAWAKTGSFPLVPFQIKFYLYYLIGTLA
jgi:hypothetical protein